MTDQDGCQLYGKQGQKCDIFKKWNRQKSSGNNINLAISYTNDDKKSLLENILQKQSEEIDYEKAILVIREEQQKRLQPELFNLFNQYYLQGNSKQLQREQKKYIKDNKKILYSEVIKIIHEFELVQDIRINNIADHEQE